MAIEQFIPYRRAIQYDGTNSAEILAQCPDVQGSDSQMHEAEIASETGGVLTIHYDDSGAGPEDVVINETDWVILPPTPGAVSAQPDWIIQATMLNVADLA